MPMPWPSIYRTQHPPWPSGRRVDGHTDAGTHKSVWRSAKSVDITYIVFGIHDVCNIRIFLGTPHGFVCPSVRPSVHAVGLPLRNRRTHGIDFVCPPVGFGGFQRVRPQRYCHGVAERWPDVAGRTADGRAIKKTCIPDGKHILPLECGHTAGSWTDGGLAVCPQKLAGLDWNWVLTKRYRAIMMLVVRRAGVANRGRGRVE